MFSCSMLFVVGCVCVCVFMRSVSCCFAFVLFLRGGALMVCDGVGAIVYVRLMCVLMMCVCVDVLLRVDVFVCVCCLWCLVYAWCVR